VALEDLVDSLTTLGIACVALPSGAEGAVLALPDYGRVLGLWPHRRGENALWVNPDFLESLRFGAKDDGWRNPGGDRMWLAPEAEFFPEGEVPSALDPGHFVRVAERSGCAMENKGDVRAWKTGTRVRFKLVRRVRPLDEPSMVDAWGPTWLRSAGYREEVVLEVTGDRPDAVRLWNLTQVPAGAQLRVPADGANTRVLSLDERDGHAHLLVKDCAREASDGEPLVECRPGSASQPGEISCSSPPLVTSGKGRILWRTSLCAFSGRVEEVRAFAHRLGGSSRSLTNR
jgi:hypothetical protein